jgi:predicted NUDIX family phosphoesterase
MSRRFAMGKLDGSERVLCVRAEFYGELGVVSGFRPEDAAWTLSGRLRRLLGVSEFRGRTGDLERDPAWKQLIPYAVLWHSGRVLAYRRRPKGGDPRLRSRASVGVGGHINPGDVFPGSDSLDPLVRCLRRELREELGIEPAGGRFVGLLDDAADDVGSVHLGVVFGVELASPEVQPREVDPLGWFEPARLRDDPELEWEGWSRILIEHGLESMTAR